LLGRDLLRLIEYQPQHIFAARRRGLYPVNLETSPQRREDRKGNKGLSRTPVFVFVLIIRFTENLKNSSGQFAVLREKWPRTPSKIIANPPVAIRTVLI
jgi:hypothetical protein